LNWFVRKIVEGLKRETLCCPFNDPGWVLPVGRVRVEKGDILVFRHRLVLDPVELKKIREWADDYFDPALKLRIVVLEDGMDLKVLSQHGIEKVDEKV